LNMVPLLNLTAAVLELISNLSKFYSRDSKELGLPIASRQVKANGERLVFEIAPSFILTERRLEEIKITNQNAYVLP
jgi:hypothetical protein